MDHCRQWEPGFRLSPVEWRPGTSQAGFHHGTRSGCQVLRQTANTLSVNSRAGEQELSCEAITMFATLRDKGPN